MKSICELGTIVPPELVDEFLKRLPYVSEGIGNFEMLEGNSRLAFELRLGFEGKIEVVAARIGEVAIKLCRNYRPGMLKTLVRRDVFPSSHNADPHPQLERDGDLIHFGRGRYGFGTKLVGLMDFFEKRAKQMASSVQASPRNFPSLIGGDVLDRCRYVQNFPSSLNMVSHLREDLGVIQEFARSARWKGGELTCDKHALSGVECLLSPSVCFHWYMWLRKSRLANPIAVTAVGKCFRYESTNLSGLERLWDFTMREIIFVGPPDYVLESKQKQVDLSVAFLDELGLAYEISSATDPFFADSYAVQAAYQQGFELKFELLAPLPYSGKKLAVGSMNYHQDFFGRSFEIETASGPAHTGCIGFGWERLALAFLAQHGVDPVNWPKAVADHVGGL